jgi:hypothetical protein
MSKLWFQLVLAVGSISFLPSAMAADEAATLKPVDPKENSPHEDLRRKIFKDSLGKGACATISTDPRGGLGGIDAELDSFVKLIVGGIKNRDPKALQPLFHKRLNIEQGAIEGTFAKLESMFGKPYDVSVYRVWALNTVDGSPKGVACDDDRLTVFPQYGYPLQMALWLQIQGPLELGRLFVSVVPANGRWNIGAFHAQQWTHASKDFATWTEEAQKASYMGYKEAAYILYDIAAKLLDAGGHIDFALRDDLIKTREAILTTAAWETAIKAQLKAWDVVYLASLLVPDGAGLLVRVRMPKEISVEAIKSECGKIVETLAKNPWHTQLSGARCSFLLPNEDAAKEGAMGGIYTEFTDVKG